MHLAKPLLQAISHAAFTASFISFSSAAFAHGTLTAAMVTSTSTPGSSEMEVWKGHQQHSFPD
jgi:hypothetical protein